MKVINKAPSNDKINVCSGNIITVKDIVETIQCEMQNATQHIYRDPCLLWENNAKLWEGEMPFKKDRMREEVEKYTIGDGSNAYRLYGWKSKTDMVTGIKEIINNK